MPVPRTILLLLPVVLILVTGCESGTPPPHGRMGGLPFPGLFTLYSAADPQKLGHHRYDQGVIPLPPYETDRGMVYTCRAGFIDLAHLRTAIDWTRYYADHVRDALGDKQTQIELAGPNYSKFVVTFRYPDDWDTLKKEERGRFADELAVRIGQRTAYQAVTWHEIITWYGYKGSLVFSETQSSFTWDDVMSHVIGIRVAGRSWRMVNVEKRPKTDYNGAVTETLNVELTALGAVTAEQTEAAVKAVEGKWWQDGKPLRRQLDIGLTTGRVTPWVVGGLSFCPETPVLDFGLPDLSDVNGRDFRGLYTVEIAPRIGQSGKIRGLLKDKPKRVDADRDLPLLVEIVRTEMRAQFGEGFDRP